jgi:hypothetical protein
LAPAEAAARLARYRSNVFLVRQEERCWKEVLESLGEPLQLLLLAVAAAYFLLGEVEDAITILVVILAVSGVEVINELSAMRAERRLLLRMNPLANRPFLVWAAAAVGMLVVGPTVPGLRDRLHVSMLDPRVWAFVLAAALILPSWWEPWKWLRRRPARRREASGAPSRRSRVD